MFTLHVWEDRELPGTESQEFSQSVHTNSFFCAWPAVCILFNKVVYVL